MPPPVVRVATPPAAAAVVAERDSPPAGAVEPVMLDAMEAPRSSVDAATRVEGADVDPASDSASFAASVEAAFPPLSFAAFPAAPLLRAPAPGAGGAGDDRDSPTYGVRVDDAAGESSAEDDASGRRRGAVSADGGAGAHASAMITSDMEQGAAFAWPLPAEHGACARAAASSWKLI